MAGTQESMPPINSAEIMERCMGSVEFLNSLLSEFEQSGCHSVGKIASFVEQKDARQAADAAHALKGVAAILAAEPLRLIAGQIEDCGRTGTIDGVQQMIVELRQEMDRCHQFIPVVKQAALAGTKGAAVTLCFS